MSIDEIIARLDGRGVTEHRILNVFLSSTDDMAEYRDAIASAIKDVDHFQCIKMDDFVASYGRSAENRRSQVQDSDLYVCLVGGRYGSIPDEGDRVRSGTVIEYETAMAEPLHILAYVAPPEALSADLLLGPEDAQKQALQQAFRRRVEDEQTAARGQRWHVPSDFADDVLMALMQTRSDLLNKLGAWRLEVADTTETAIWTGRPDTEKQGDPSAVAASHGTADLSVGNEMALRSWLADAYPDFQSQRIVAEDAGIDAEAVNLNNSALIAWANILTELRLRDRLPGLLDRLRNDDYPEGVALLEAYIAETKRPAPPPPRQTPPPHTPSHASQFLSDTTGTVAVNSPSSHPSGKRSLIPAALAVGGVLALGGAVLSGGLCGIGIGCAAPPAEPLPTMADLSAALETYAPPSDGMMTYEAATGTITFASPPDDDTPFIPEIALPGFLPDHVNIIAETPAPDGAAEAHCLQASDGMLALGTPLQSGERVRFMLSIASDAAARAACATVLPYWKPVPGAQPARARTRALVSPEAGAPLFRLMAFNFPRGTTAYTDPERKWVRVLMPGKKAVYMRAHDVSLPGEPDE